MMPGDAIRQADVNMQVFCKALAGKVRELLPEASRLRFRLTIAVEGSNVRVDPQLRPYREGQTDSDGFRK